MPETFISPYDDFENWLVRQQSADAPATQPQFVPVLCRITSEAMARIPGMGEAFSQWLDDASDDVRQIFQTSEDIDALVRFLEEDHSDQDPELLRDWLAFLGRVVMFLPVLPDGPSIDERALEFRLPRSDAEDAGPRLFEPLWFGPLMSERQLPRTFERGDLILRSRDTTLIGRPVTGIIDDGIGYLNTAFRNTDNQTRFDAVWLQQRPLLKSTGIDLGEVLGPDDIDALIADTRSEAQIYDADNRRLYPNETYHGTSRAFTHGTHVLGLASETDRDTPARDPLLAVQLPPFSIRDTTGHYLSFFAFLGLRFMMRRMVGGLLVDIDGMTAPTGLRPLLVNISLGALAGPKDGSGPFEREFARECTLYEHATKSRVRTFFAFGNSHEDRQVAKLSIPAGKDHRLRWRLHADDRTASFMELRSDSAIRISLRNRRTGNLYGPYSPSNGTYNDMSDDDGRVVARIYGNTAWSYTPQGALQKRPDGWTIALRPTHHALGDSAGDHGLWDVIVQNQSAVQAELTAQIQSGGTPPGYLIHGRQSFFEDPQPDGASVVVTDGTYSALVPPKSEQHLAVAAAQWAPDSATAWQPMAYSAAGGLFSSRAAPTEAAMVEDGFLSGGQLGPGTLSGTSGRLGGTSAAAAIALSSFADRVRAVVGSKFDAFPQDAEENAPNNSRLGAARRRRDGVAAGVSGAGPGPSGDGTGASLWERFVPGFLKDLFQKVRP